MDVDLIQRHANVDLLLLRGLERGVKQAEGSVGHIGQLVGVDGLVLNLNDQLMEAEADLGSRLSHANSLPLITFRRAAESASQT